MALTQAYASMQAGFTMPFGTGIGNASPEITLGQPYTIGTADGNVDVAYTATLSVTTSPTSLNLVDGSLKRLDGTSAIFAEIVELIVIHKGTTGTVTVGGGSTPVIAALDPIKAGGKRWISEPTSAGLPAVAASSHLLALTASTGTIPVTVFILGRSV